MMQVLVARNIRQLVQMVNEYNLDDSNKNKITKDKIVTIIEKDNQVLMIYFN